MLVEINSVLKQLTNLPENKRDVCLHEISNLLVHIEELTENHYTIIPGNNNFLDLIRYLDLTEFSQAYCPTCKKLQQITAEGCDEIVLFTCDSCNEIVAELYRTKN